MKKAMTVPNATITILKAVEGVCLQKQAMKEKNAARSVHTQSYHEKLSIIAEWRSRLPSSDSAGLHSEDCDMS
jgi:hypothetical protein